MTVVRLLDSSHYHGLMGMPSDSGMQEGTHVALIRADKSRAVPFYVKFYEPTTMGLLNEIIGYTLLHHLKIRQPKQAGVIIVPVSKYTEAGGILPQWLDPNTYPKIPAWCTEAIPGNSLQKIYKHRAYIDSHIATLIRHSQRDFSAIAAIDEAMSHADRHGGNIVRHSRAAHSFIDNGLILSGYLWNQIGLYDHGKNYLLDTARRQVTDTDVINKFINAMVYSAEKHHDAYCDACLDIQFWADKLLSANNKKEQLDKLMDFIGSRMNPLWMNDRLGVC